jgi:Trk-type K+ transport system membrane component
LLLKDLTNTSRITDIFKTLKRVILTTFIIEAAGAFIIFFSMNKGEIANAGDRVFFSVFHSVSGFCNAGFSTLQNNLFEQSVRYNYVLQLTIAFLIILGGLGFPIVFNFMHYIKHLFVNRIIPYFQGKEARHLPWVININSRIVIITTTILLIGGTGLFYFFEYNNTLAEHSGFGKIVTAFFGASTPRTAGFNTVDTSALHFHTIMMIFFLMWVGASPASTGGGIKTSTLAISFLNFINLAKGKDRIEIFRRQISNESVKRAYATITLSLVVVGLSIFLVSYFDREKDLRSIAFECFSALGTVGLSLGITAKLSVISKYIIIITMLIGRVGMLTILMALFNKMKHYKYQYPTEEIMIN